jgi:hypothetical protein
MRGFRLVFLSLIFSLAGFAAWQVPAVNSSVQQAMSRVESFFFAKEIRFVGLQYAKSEEIEKLLPAQSSVFWWIFARSSIEEALRRHPWVEQASLESCGLLRWGCFALSVQERVPRFRAMNKPAEPDQGEDLPKEEDVVKQLDQAKRRAAKQEQWLIDEDGSFIEPIHELESWMLDLPLLRGALDAEISPAMVAARLRLVARALDALEETLGRRVSGMFFLPSGEIELRFRGQTYVVLLSAGESGEEGKKQLQSEILRLQELLEEFRGRERLLKKIDLAHRRQAVVSLWNSPEP